MCDATFSLLKPFVLLLQIDVVLLTFQELQKLKHWEQSTEQMMQEREELLNSIGSKRTVNLDRLAEMRRKVSASQIKKKKKKHMTPLNSDVLVLFSWRICSRW